LYVISIAHVRSSRNSSSFLLQIPSLLVSLFARISTGYPVICLGAVATTPFNYVSLSPTSHPPAQLHRHRCALSPPPTSHSRFTSLRCNIHPSTLLYLLHFAVTRWTISLCLCLLFFLSIPFVYRSPHRFATTPTPSLYILFWSSLQVLVLFRGGVVDYWFI